MIILRSDDEIDRRLPAHDVGALGLCDAAGDHDRCVETRGGPLLLQFANLAEFGIDFFRGALPDVAGVEHDKVGILDSRRFLKALASRHIGHAMGVVDIHLAAVGFYEHPPGLIRGRAGVFE